jgi:hypothetical protein
MKAEKWMILGALAGIAALAINKQLRLRRHRRFAPLSEYSKREAQARASIDDIPTLQQAAAREVDELDESVAPAAPF